MVKDEQGVVAAWSGAAADGFQLVSNTAGAGANLLAVIKGQLGTCDSFDFCVAFVAESGLQPLVQILAELRARGVRGRVLTSTYLNFNSPAAFRKLLSYENIETRVYQGNLHAKGYLFNRDGASTVIVGSSNLTQMALTCNQEWNVLFQTVGDGPDTAGIGAVKREFEALWQDELTVALSDPWISGYEGYRTQEQRPTRQQRPAFRALEPAVVEFDSSSEAAASIQPNEMQRLALEALQVIHGRNESRALLVSATGTGKTYLSAFDVRAMRPRRVLFLAHRRRILSASMESYQKLLGDAYRVGLYEPGGAATETLTCVFAMCSTMVRHLDEFNPRAFDYIVIDEAHRTGSGSYQAIMRHFEPAFYLGMTATPNRTDGYDVFALFNHVIAFQITLQDALANDMLAPFHYFGIADLEIDYEQAEDVALFSSLTSDERVRHITRKIEEYTVDPSKRCGLIFCNRNDEAAELSARFNALGYRTTALSGANSDEERDRAIERLERGEIEYIFSVDIFNEGVDIPSLNQIIMLRRTESPIVFVQQLGRGLRKAEGKDYALVLDFIGNYQRNFFVPVALSGDRTYNKDTLRTVVKEGSSIVPGCSTVSFDRISEARIYKAIDGGDFSAAKFIKAEYLDLRQQLGRVPGLLEFDSNGAIDPLLIFRKFGSYHEFLSKYEDGYEVAFSDAQRGALKFVSQKLAAGKRFEDLFLLRELIERGPVTMTALQERAASCGRCVREVAVDSAARVLSGAFAGLGKSMPLVAAADAGYALTPELVRALVDAEFRRQLLEVVDFGLARNRAAYAKTYRDTSLVLCAKYTYEEVCRLLNWEKNVNGQNLGGYKFDEPTKTFPVFINYDKDPGISETIKYEDRFVSDRELIAISKQPRRLDSPEIERLRAWPGNGMRIYLFVRKNKDDKVSKEFYFLGEMEPLQRYASVTVAGKPAVEISYRLETPVRADLYHYLTSDFAEDTAEDRA